MEHRLNRLKANVVVSAEGCWEWQGPRDRDGYGRVHLTGYSRLAYRAMYELTVGPVPAGMELHHCCENRGCCNPLHLKVVTHAENMRLSRPAQQTHCKHGHEFTPENTYIRADGRQRSCRRCNFEAARRYVERRRKAVA